MLFLVHSVACETIGARFGQVQYDKKAANGLPHATKCGLFLPVSAAAAEVGWRG